MEEITAEYAAEDLAQAVELRVKPKVTVACKSDLGRVRENNEDKLEFFLPEDERLLATRGQVFVVCDGMGGHAAGQIASELTCKTFIDVYLNHPAELVQTAMRAGVQAANRFVNDVARAVPSRKGMGTTCTALVLLQDEAYTVHVGDSRAYRLRAGELTQLTSDHTWCDEAIRSGMLTPEEAEVHPYRHVLTRAVGTEETLPVDVEAHGLQVGDTFLLCSDGLTNHVKDEEIAELLALAPSEAVWKLVGQALVGGGSDNCTALVVRVDALETQSSSL
ncbi:MAG TPA: Stp1/IreP family PP2C-type Ser/Thr phosphatase [Fimbriimonadaceae bacterium]|nr:Stp1/IreP family PP2C-type Ser/Thr phosphatase [Fimbriimonadaceae bacterium]